MGQQEVCDYINSQPKGNWYTSKQISEALNIGLGSVTVSLNKLRRKNFIEFKEARKTGKGGTRYLYTSMVEREKCKGKE